MNVSSLLTLAATLGLGLTLSAAPLEAQGKGKGHKEKDKAERVLDERFGEYGQRAGNGNGKVPPGWCKGKGNPHNTPENCGYYGMRGDGRWYDDRDGDRGRYRSFAEAHESFHRYLDRKYSDLAARRPLDLPYQIRLRAEKATEHDRWHDRMGRSH